LLKENIAKRRVPLCLALFSTKCYIIFTYKIDFFADSGVYTGNVRYNSCCMHHTTIYRERRRKKIFNVYYVTHFAQINTVICRERLLELETPNDIDDTPNWITTFENTLDKF